MVTTAPNAFRSMQGIQVPSSSVNPQAFQQATRRLTVPQKTANFAGLGLTDTVRMLQVGIIDSLTIKLSISTVVTLGGGTAATTAAWPYGFIKNCRFAANGQSQLINVGGLDLKLHEIQSTPGLSDRGVNPGAGINGASPGTTTTQGTLAMASEAWGVGSNVTAIPAGTYTTELFYRVPISADPTTLVGAVFAQTASTDLQLVLDWAAPTDLFALTGAATAVVSCAYSVEAITYSIPQAPNGGILIPDLSLFHSLTRNTNSAIANGTNEFPLIGAGIGRNLERVTFRVLNGTAPARTPLAATAANYGQLAWRFGGNDTPELVVDGRTMRYMNERLFGSDISAVWGYLCWDFVSQNTLRDIIDESTATELRLVVEIPSAVTLTTPMFEMTQETLFAGAVGA